MLTQSNSFKILENISSFLDSKFTIFGIRFGFDFILSFIPVIGVLITQTLSVSLILFAVYNQVSFSVILRMLLNIAIDGFLSVIPVAGQVADIFWRSNTRNISLLRSFSEEPKKVIHQSRWINASVVAAILGMIWGTVYVSYKVIMYLIMYISSMF